jgi:hypothetical protein
MSNERGSSVQRVLLFTVFSAQIGQILLVSVANNLAASEAANWDDHLGTLRDCQMARVL